MSISRIFSIFIVFLFDCAHANTNKINLIEPTVYQTYVSWDVGHGVGLDLLGIKSSIFQESETYVNRILNVAKEQKEEDFRPAWDLFGLVLKEKSKISWHSDYSDYSDYEYYVEALIDMSAAVEIKVPSLHERYNENSKPEVKRVIVDGVVVCGNGVYCRESEDYEYRPNKFEVSIILDKVKKGEPVQIELTFNQPIDQDGNLSANYFLNTKKIQSLIDRAVLKGQASADEYNARVDILRGDILKAVKVQYFIYFLYLMCVIALINNRAYLYQYGEKALFACMKFASFIFIYPRRFVRHFKLKIVGEKSILMKSDGLTKVSVSEELMRWNQLKESNVISEEEFNKVKEKLLETLRDNDSKK